MEECLAHLPKLEPLLGISLAMNLAYLNLPIFHFMSLISKSAGDCLSGLPESTRTEVQGTDWYADAKSLATLQEIERGSVNITAPKWLRFESYWASFFFNVFFYYKVGKYGSVAATAFASSMILLGTLGSISDAKSFECNFSTYFGAPFKLSVFAFVWPILCVLVGATLRHFVMKKIRYNLKGLGQKAVKEASDAITQTEQAIRAKPRIRM